MAALPKGKQSISALEAVQKAMAEAQKELVPASQALAAHEGKILKPLQYDRMRVNLPTNDLGGPEYSFLSLINDPHAAAGSVAAVSNKTALSKLVNQYKDMKPGSVIHVPMLGSEVQHRGNPTMFARLHDEVMNKIKKGEIDQEQIDVINNRLNSTDVGKKGKPKLLFPEPVDIASPEFRLKPYTFEQRSEFADVVSGAGIIQTLGKERGKMIDLASRLGETIDPYIADAPTGAFGHRIVELGTNTLYDPALHGDYPYHIIGKDMGVRFKPFEKKFMTDFTKQIMEDPKKARIPNDMDFRTGNVSQEVTPEWLQYLKDSGNKDGGSIHPDGSMRLAGGGSAKKTIQAILKAADMADLPPAANSARTQIVGTMPTYEKARDILGKEGIKGADILDFGAGKGLGSTAMKAHSFEPYPQGWHPTYTQSKDIPSEEYKGLLNLNVLNVLDPEMRAHTVKEIGRVIRPEGTGLITTRGKDVMNTIGGRPGPEPMSVITSRDTYQKGYSPEELRAYIQHILGSDYEYEPLGLGAAGVKIKKKAEGGAIEDDTRRIVRDPSAYLMDEIQPIQPIKHLNPILSAMEGYRKSGQFMKNLGKMGIDEVKENYERAKKHPIGQVLTDVGTNVVSDFASIPQMIQQFSPARISSLNEDEPNYLLPKGEEEKPYPFVGSSEFFKKGFKDTGIASGEQYPAFELAAGMFPTAPIKAASAVGKVGKEAFKEGLRQIHTGEGLLGRNVMNPRMNIIKDPGGMLVGGEKALDNELLYMKKTENAYPHAQANFVTDQKDTDAIALNNWIDTKVRKYLRNQAGTEADPILKAIESGVEHNFTPPQSGDTKYSIAMKREMVGKPKEGIAKTELGKEFEYKVDSMFNPKRSEEIKDILNDPNKTTRQKELLLRVQEDLPIEKLSDIELINQIPDKNVYTLSGTNITDRLGLNHVSDVLMEDLRSGKLKPEQLNQMSMEKAIRRTAEYDAQKAKEMTKAHAISVEGMPVSREYDDGYKWIELKHEDVAKTKSALKSEGEMMGHCVGSYCDDVSRGHVKIYSLRSPDGKSHVTIESRPHYNAQQWKEANADLIKSDPVLTEIEENVARGDIDSKYGNNSITDRDYVRIMELNMLERKIQPIEPEGYVELKQVKGKQNKRPDEKYQKYVSDFIQNKPFKHEIADVSELHNTNLMSVNDVARSGIVPKEIHFHPDVEKAISSFYPAYKSLMASEKEELTYRLFKTAAKDLARQNKNYFTGEDLLENIRNKYLPKPKAKGGSIDLQQEYKLESMRRRYG